MPMPRLRRLIERESSRSRAHEAQVVFATSESDYIAKAVALAAEVDSLRKQRRELREKMARSPLCDIESYVGDLEALYGRLWKTYCAGSAQALLA